MKPTDEQLTNSLYSKHHPYFWTMHHNKGTFCLDLREIVHIEYDESNDNSELIIWFRYGKGTGLYVARNVRYELLTAWKVIMNIDIIQQIEGDDV